MKKLLAVALWLVGILAVIHATDRYTQIEENTMAITESTYNFIKGFEGKRNRAYKDSKGLWTIGVGHLIKPDEQYLKTLVLTDHDVEELFKRDLSWCDAAVSESVTVPLTQNQFDALYSLCFNIGADHFKNSEVVHHLNKNDYNGAADAFMHWVTPAVLKPRREKEKALFLGA